MAHTRATVNLLAQRIGTVWADVLPAGCGIFLSNELQLIDWETKIKGGAGVPIAVLDFRQTGTHEYGGDPGRDIGPVWIYRVVDDGEAMEVLLDRLDALRSSLWLNRADLLPTCQLLSYPSIEFHMDLPLVTFFRETAKPLTAGALMLTLEAGEEEAP